MLKWSVNNLHKKSLEEDLIQPDIQGILAQIVDHGYQHKYNGIPALTLIMEYQH